MAPASAAAFMVAVPPRFFYAKGVLEMIPEKSKIFQWAICIFLKGNVLKDPRQRIYLLELVIFHSYVK